MFQSNRIIHAILFGIPLIVISIGPSHFELPKLIVAATAILFLLVISVWTHKKSLHTIYRPFTFCLIAIFMLNLIHLIVFQTDIIWFGNSFRYQGTLTLWLLLTWAYLISRHAFSLVKSYWYLSILVLLTLSSLVFGNDNNRSVGTLGEPNALAAYAIFLWPFALFSSRMLNATKQKSVITILILCTSVVLLLTGSRSGLIALTLQLLLLTSYHLTGKLNRSMLLTVICYVLTLTIPFLYTTEYENRADIWNTAFQAGLLSPIIGNGFGNTELALREVIVREHNSLIGYYIDSSHNQYLDWWVQGGLIGLIALMSVIGISIRRLLQQKNILSLLILTGMITALSFNPASIVGLIHLWWVIGSSFRTEE